MQIEINGKPRQVPAQFSLTALLEQLELQPQHVAVEVNLELVPRQQHAQRTLSEGDRVEIVTLAGGG